MHESSLLNPKQNLQTKAQIPLLQRVKYSLSKEKKTAHSDSYGKKRFIDMAPFII